MTKRKVYRKKRSFLKKRTARKNTKTTTTVKSLSPISPRLVTKLKYCETISTTVTGGVLNQYQFNLNSIYDPNETGTGHQPYGLDQLVNFYGRYRVFAVSYRIEVFNASSTNVTVGILPHNTSHSFSGTSTDYLAECPRAQVKTLTSTGGPGKVSFKGRINLAQLNGVTSAQYKADDRFQSVYNNTPTERMYFTILQSCGSTSQTAFTIRLMYHVELFDPFVLAQS